MSNHTRHLPAMALIAATLLLSVAHADAKERRIAKPATADITAAQLEDNDTLRRALAPRTNDRTAIGRQPGKGK